MTAGDSLEQGVPSERFESFVREYGERAFQFAYRLSGDIEESKDLVQDAFCRVLDHWDRYDPSQALDGWFFTILRNLFRDCRKRYERRHSVSLDRPVLGEEGSEVPYADLLPREEEAVIETLERKESSRTVREALEALSCEHHAILTLCDMQGLSYEQISRVLEVPVGTVRSRVSRARRALRARLAGKEEDNG